MSRHEVAYQPLGLAPLQGYECDVEADEEENNESEEADFLKTYSPSSGGHHRAPAIQIRQLTSRLGLRHLRVILYLIAIVLFLIFMTQLSRNDYALRKQRLSSINMPVNSSRLPTNQHQLHSHHLHQIEGRELTSESQQSNKATSSSLNIKDQPSENDLNTLTLKQRPTYESYLSSVLRSGNSYHSHIDADGESIDDLHYPNDYYANSRHVSSVWWEIEMRNSGKQLSVTNYIRAMKSFNTNSSITLTTQATTEFMYHTLELCKRWDGPLSVAIFCPGPELTIATSLIKYMRQCLPAPLSACIRDRVSWHLVYDKEHGPEPSEIHYPKYHLDTKNSPLFASHDQCPKLAGPEPADLIRQYEEQLKRKNGIWATNYRQIHKLTYPINVLRNTARLAAKTKYVLASDIELYPSLNLVPMFEGYLKRHNVTDEFKHIKKYVFALPIFEVRSNVTAPKTKQQLIRMFEDKDAIFFHKWVCDVCQNFPNRDVWIKSDKFSSDGIQSQGDDELIIFEAQQRDKSLNSWEPIYIGTNQEPLYDERLSWEGRRDKMAQMVDLCLQDYYFLVLGNAFLVHAPGIKHIDSEDVTRRISYIRENNRIYDSTIADLKRQHSNSSTVDRC